MGKSQQILLTPQPSALPTPGISSTPPWVWGLSGVVHVPLRPCPVPWQLPRSWDLLQGCPPGPAGLCQGWQGGNTAVTARARWQGPSPAPKHVWQVKKGKREELMGANPCLASFSQLRAQLGAAAEGGEASVSHHSLLDTREARAEKHHRALQREKPGSSSPALCHPPDPSCVPSLGGAPFPRNPHRGVGYLWRRGNGTAPSLAQPHQRFPGRFGGNPWKEPLGCPSSSPSVSPLQ